MMMTKIYLFHTVQIKCYTAGLRQETKYNNTFKQNIIAIYMYMYITLSIHVFQLKKEMYYNVKLLLTNKFGTK